jgi:D-glycero-alpha-D-manno-heptose 1-phosphate guanylyltransferase
MIDALVLAGGLGTRMRPILHDYPKCMASIAEKPFLDYLLLQLKKHHVTEVILCLSYRGELIREYYRRSEVPGLCLRYSHESEPLGTGGALKRAESLIRSPEFLVLNGDSFFDIDVQSLIRSHRSRKGQATIALAEVDDRQRYGAVEIDERGQITRFLEKARAARGVINGGIYVLGAEIFALIPPGRAVSLERDVFPQLIGRGLFGTLFQAYFADIGVPESYLRLQADPSGLLAAVA